MRKFPVQNFEFFESECAVSIRHRIHGLHAGFAIAWHLVVVQHVDEVLDILGFDNPRLFTIENEEAHCDEMSNF
jgi:hypothetical protein